MPRALDGGAGELSLADGQFDGMVCSPPGARLASAFGLVRREVHAPPDPAGYTSLGDGWMPYDRLSATDSSRKPTPWPRCARAFDAIRPRQCHIRRLRRGARSRRVGRAHGGRVPALAEVGINVIRFHLRRFAQSVDDILPLVTEITRRFEDYRDLRA